MTRHIRIRRNQGRTGTGLRWLGFAAAVAVGIVLGWNVFQSPGPAATGGGTPSSDMPEADRILPSDVRVEASGAWSQSMGSGVGVGKAAPDFRLPGLDGAEISLSDLHGQVVLVNFWTTWCPPCRSEMPALQEVYERRREQGFQVLGINWTALDDPELVAPYVLELGLTFPILLDVDGRVSGEIYNLRGLPTSVFVGRDGTVLEIRIGALDLKYLDERIAVLLEEAS